MSNKEVYQKTLVFSVRRLLVNFIMLLLFGAICGAMYLIVEKTTNRGLIGLGIGVVIAIIVVALISHFYTYTLQAGQIAMMMKGVTENSLPDDVYGEGKRIVKERFTTVAAYYFATGLIKGIFRQLGNAITKLGSALGGDTGETIGGIISTIIQVLIGFLCDCCLGWVFYRDDIPATKATCEGAVIFFKNGKTLLRNMGRIFGMGIVSLLVIGGAFAGIFYLIFSSMGSAFQSLADEIMEAAARAGETVPTFFQDPNNLALVAAGIAAVVIWSILHGTFIRPFILTGVLRNFMEAGVKNMPQESDFDMLDGKSPKFKKLHSEL